MTTSREIQEDQPPTAVEGTVVGWLLEHGEERAKLLLEHLLKQGLRTLRMRVRGRGISHLDYALVFLIFIGPMINFRLAPSGSSSMLRGAYQL
jgi:hypothetical protein